MTQQSARQILSQQRAKWAYEFAEEGSKLNKNKKVDRAYKSYTKKIPMLIKTNGLGATFAFVKAKANKDTSKRDHAYEVIYKQTERWLRETMPHIFQDKQGKPLKNQDLVYVFITQESHEYRQIAVEVLAFFTWLKRFAEGLIEGEDNGD